MNSLYGYGQNVAKAISSNTRGTFVEVGGEDCILFVILNKERKRYALIR